MEEECHRFFLADVAKQGDKITTSLDEDNDEEDEEDEDDEEEPEEDEEMGEGASG